MVARGAGPAGGKPFATGSGEVVSPTVEVAFLDRDGVIEWVNAAWIEFCLQNGGDPARAGVGVSYLTACDAAADDPAATAVGRTIRTALGGELASPVTVRIACDSPSAARWFDVLIAPRDDLEGNLIGASVSLAVASDPATSRTQDRLWTLIRAIGATSGEPDLRVALLHVVEAARELGAARFAGLQLRDEDGRPGCSITVGVEDDPTDLPTATLRVPIRFEGADLGTLTLAGSRRGGFTAQDETLLAALVEAAAVSIRNARRHDLAERRGRWREAATALAHELICGAAGRSPGEVVLDHALSTADGDRAELVVTVDDGRVVLSAVAGAGVERTAPPRFDDGPLGRVLRDGTPLLVDAGTAPAKPAPSETAPPGRSRASGSMLVVPITTAPGEAGALSVARAPGRPGFDRRELAHLTEFAQSAGVALGLRRTRAEHDNLALAVDHDRIAAELHDHVIPELFATGMGLEAMVHDLDRPGQQERVLRFVDDLDITIRHIRTAIFQMDPRPDAQPDGLSTEAR